jgi:hypothetical protein
VTELMASSDETRTRGILCGVRGAEHRSTKHSRGVTCRACVGLLDAQRALDAEAARGAHDVN